MEAQPTAAARRLIVTAGLAGCVLAASAAAAQPSHNVSLQRSSGYRTENFIVRAPSQALAREIGEAAEQWREQLAIEWVGKPMPKWTEPCPINAKVAPNLGAGGATTFVFDRGQVFGWEMEIQGSRERVLDSVLPHEITHTVFASHFRKPLPRWADEGACTTVEHRSEIVKQERLLINFLKSQKGIPFSQMFAMKEYPQDILPLYAQGYSLTQYLIEKHGKQEFMAFLNDGMRDENWRRAVEDNYGHENLYSLQTEWLGWVKAGRPRLDTVRSDAPVQLASATTPAPVSRTPSVYGRRAEEGAPTPAMASVYGGEAVWRKPEVE